MRRNPALADVSFANVRVPVDVRTERRLRVVGVDQLHVLDSQHALRLPDSLTQACRARDVVPGGQQMAGIQAIAHRHIREFAPHNRGWLAALRTGCRSALRSRPYSPVAPSRRCSAEPFAPHLASPTRKPQCPPPASAPCNCRDAPPDTRRRWPRRAPIRRGSRRSTWRESVGSCRRQVHQIVHVNRQRIQIQPLASAPQ